MFISWASEMLFIFRSLRRTAGFTIVAVLTLGLGIGANTAIFSGVNALLLGPMPYQHPEQIVAVWEDASSVGFPHNTPAPANFVDWQRLNHVFSGMAALRFRVANLTGEGKPEVAVGKGVTANFFNVLGAHPLLGRTFTPEEDHSGAKVVVISYQLWQERFNGSRDAIGKTLHMNNEPYTVIGVMPAGFAFPNRQFQFWDPAHFTPSDLARRGSHFLQVVARLKSDVSLLQAQAEMSSIGARLERAYPKTNRTIGVVVVPLRADLVGDTRIAFLILFAAATAVLLIACANVANLLLIRGTGRQQELAVRSAVGASRGQLVRQLVAESMALSVAGALVGIAFAGAGITALQTLVPPDLVNSTTLSLDVPVLCFAILVSFASGLIFGILPAFRSSRLDLNEALKQGGRSVAGASSGLRKLFVISQVAIALVLLAAAGLMIQTLANLRSVPLGFQSGHLLTMATPLSPQAYNTDPKILSFANRTTDKLSALPEVQGAAFASDLPFTSIGNTNGFRIEGRAPSPADDFNDALYREVSTNYLRVLGVNLLAGRLTDRRDTATSQPVVVINQTFAHQFWRRRSPLGSRIVVGGQVGPENPWRTVIGIIADVRERGLQLNMKPAVYLPFPQVKSPSANYLIVRTPLEPAELANIVRNAIWSVDPEQPVARVRPMQEYVDRELNNRGRQMKILGVFAGLALFLACLGIYGVLAYSVEQRRREIGVRVALGADTANVAGLVLRQGMSLSLAGIFIGLALAFGSTRVLHDLLFEVKPVEPMTFAQGAAILLFFAFAACIIPAVSAARVDPMIALRNE